MESDDGLSSDEMTCQAVLHSTLPNYHSAVPTCRLGEVPREIEVGLKSGNTYFEIGIFVKPPAEDRKKQLLVSCVGEESHAFLNIVRGTMRTLSKTPLSTRRESETFNSDISQVFAATGLLRSSDPQPTGEVARKVAETRLQAFRLLAPGYEEGVMDECRRLIKSIPEFAPSRLQCADALIELGQVRGAIDNIWYALLLCKRTSVWPGYRNEEKAIGLLNKCVKISGIFSVRLDIVILQDHGDNPENALASRGPLNWRRLTEDQKNLHQQFISKIRSDITVERSPATGLEKRIVAIRNGECTKMMKLLSSLVPNVLMVSSAPKSQNHIKGLGSLGVSCVVTITKELPLPSNWFVNEAMSNVILPVGSMRPPSFDQVETFFAEVLFANASGRQVLLHCGDGRGWSGTICAAFFIVFGVKTILNPLCSCCMEACATRRLDFMRIGTCEENHCSFSKLVPKMSPSEAIELVQTLRPNSIESEAQEKFIQEYSRELWRRSSQDQHVSRLPTRKAKQYQSSIDIGPCQGQFQRRVDIHKFPRTRHLLNLGGAGVSRDDLVLATQETWSFIQKMNVENASSRNVESAVCTIEEKVDGANVAFSLAESGEVLAQNRSHYVDEGSHVQFKQLRSYIRDKYAVLSTILRGGQYILYGEWLYAKHSIHYTSLPSYFVAFDLVSNSFLTSTNSVAASKAMIF